LLENGGEIETKYTQKVKRTHKDLISFVMAKHINPPSSNAIKTLQEETFASLTCKRSQEKPGQTA
jgi:hypothetical protein